MALAKGYLCEEKCSEALHLVIWTNIFGWFWQIHLALAKRLVGWWEMLVNERWGGRVQIHLAIWTNIFGYFWQIHLAQAKRLVRWWELLGNEGWGSNTLCNLDKYIWLILTNTFGTSQKAGQVMRNAGKWALRWPCSNTPCNLDKYIWLFLTNTFGTSQKAGQVMRIAGKWGLRFKYTLQFGQIYLANSDKYIWH